MGKGDKRSRRGKIWKGSYGNARRKKKVKEPAFVPKAKPKPKKIVTPTEVTLSETPMIETAEVTQAEVKVVKPKKVAVKKPKVEAEAKATVKKEPKKKITTESTETKKEE